MPEGAQPLLLVGAGKMGGAMLERWAKSGLDPRRTTVLDPYLSPERRSEVAALGASIAASPADAPPANATIVLAVKPQTIGDVLPGLAAHATSETLIVSIVAGARLARLETGFPPRQPIVRAMPNTPARIGLGMTVALANAHVSETKRSVANGLLAAIGDVAWIDDEDMLDSVTALSGSGPAYIFLFTECLAEAGRRAGLPRDLADRLARATVIGAGALLAADPAPPAALRRDVTSPGGTTAAALDVLMAEDGLAPLLTRAVEAARRRSTELG
jgi:pyrroline-5-carboxylate reductase